MARRNLVTVPLVNKTIPHDVTARFRGGSVVMRPAGPGTGLIAGGGMRAVLDLAGVQDVLAKSLGSSNPINVVKATMDAIAALSTKDQAKERRGLVKL